MYKPDPLTVELLREVCGVGYVLTPMEKEILEIAKKEEARLPAHPEENTAAKGVIS